MATTAQHIAARSDADLMDRFVASAEQMGIKDAANWVRANMGQLVTKQVDGEQTVSDVHAYASSVRQEYIDATPERPGQNLGAVTDAHLTAAIVSTRPPESPAAE